MKFLKHTAYIFLLLGGLNWGVYGLSKYDLVEVLVGQVPVIARIVYVLVGLSALYVIFSRLRFCECVSCSCDSTCSHSLNDECGCVKKTSSASLEEIKS